MKYIEKEYNELKISIAKMCENVKRLIDSSIDALLKKDTKIAIDVIKNDSEIDTLEIEIEELCMRILALYEPKAVDLRFVITALRIIIDLERIGDICGNIAKQVIKLNTLPQIKPYIDLPKISEFVSKMLTDAIDAFFKRDIAKSYNLISSDDYVDTLNIQIIRELLEILKKNPEKTEQAISLMIISKNYERIADHITNIAEQIVFMATGEIIKHKKLKEIEYEKDIDN